MRLAEYIECETTGISDIREGPDTALMRIVWDMYSHLDYIDNSRLRYRKVFLGGQSDGRTH